MTEDRAFEIYKSNPPFVSITESYVEHIGWAYRITYDGENHGHCMSEYDGINTLAKHGVITKELTRYWLGYYDRYSPWHSTNLWYRDRKEKEQ